MQGVKIVQTIIQPTLAFTISTLSHSQQYLSMLHNSHCHRRYLGGYLADRVSLCDHVLCGGGRALVKSGRDSERCASLLPLLARTKNIAVSYQSFYQYISCIKSQQAYIFSSTQRRQVVLTYNRTVKIQRFLIKTNVKL